MFGFPNIEAMVRSFSGDAHEDVESNTWKDMNPVTDYEVLVVPVDVEGNNGELVTIPVSTKQQGGDGIAQVAITSDGVTEYEDEKGKQLV